MIFSCKLWVNVFFIYFNLNFLLLWEELVFHWNLVVLTGSKDDAPWKLSYFLSTSQSYPKDHLIVVSQLGSLAFSDKNKPPNLGLVREPFPTPDIGTCLLNTGWELDISFPPFTEASGFYSLAFIKNVFLEELWIFSSYSPCIAIKIQVPFSLRALISNLCTSKVMLTADMFIINNSSMLR